MRSPFLYVFSLRSLYLVWADSEHTHGVHTQPRHFLPHATASKMREESVVAGHRSSSKLASCTDPLSYLIDPVLPVILYTLSPSES